MSWVPPTTDECEKYEWLKWWSSFNRWHAKGRYAHYNIDIDMLTAEQQAAMVDILRSKNIIYEVDYDIMVVHIYHADAMTCHCSHCAWRSRKRTNK